MLRETHYYQPPKPSLGYDNYLSSLRVRFCQASQQRQLKTYTGSISAA